jgi:hypothetical protein
VDDFEEIFCPFCKTKMDIAMRNNVDQFPIPMASCPNCNLTALAEYLEDEEFRQRSYDYHLRILLGHIATGQRALGLIRNTSWVGSSIIDLMVTEVSNPISFVTNRPLFPLSDDDIANVKYALGL